MAEKGDERQHTNPSLRKTLASTEGAHRQKEPDPLSWNRSRRMSSPGSSSRSSTSHGGDLRQLLNRGINWIEESLSPPHCILYSFYHESFCKFHLRYFQRYREPYCDLRRVSWNNGKKEPAAIPRRSTLSSGREAFQPGWGKRGELSAGRQTYYPVSTYSRLNYHNWAERDRGNERSSHLLKADLSKSQGVENENQQGLSSARTKLSNLNDENRHDVWRPYSPVMARSRSRSLLHSSQATHNAKEDSDSKDTDCHRSPNRGSNSWSRECSAVRSRDMRHSTEDKRKRNGQDSSRSPEHKWRKTGPHPDRSRCIERSVSPEKRSRNAGWGHGRSRGRGSTDLSSLSRLNRSPGTSPTDTKKTNEEREKLGFSSTQKNLKQTMSAKWGQSDAGPPMLGKREEKQQPNPSVWDNFAQTQEAPSQNNDGWDQSINNDRQSMFDGSGTSPVHSNLHLSTPSNRTSSGSGRGIIKRNARISCKWPPIHLMKSISRGANTPRWGQASPNVDGSRSSTVSQWSKVAQDSMKNTNQKESDGWGQNYSLIRNSRSKSLTRSFEAAVDTNNNNQETDRWGMALDQTSPGGGLKLYPYHYSTLVSTSCSGGTDTKMGTSRTRGSDIDTKMGTSQARGSDIESAVNPVDPTSEVPNLGQSQPNQNHVEAIGTAAVETIDVVDNHSFQWALIGFVKPKLKPFWLKQLLNDANYLEILDKFVNNVTRSLGTCAPQTHEDSCKFLEEQNDCLSKFLLMYLGRFVTEDVIMNMRYGGRNEEVMVFP